MSRNLHCCFIRAGVNVNQGLIITATLNMSGSGGAWKVGPRSSSSITQKGLFSTKITNKSRAGSSKNTSNYENTNQGYENEKTKLWTNCNYDKTVRQESKLIFSTCGMRGRYKDSAMTESEPGN